MKVSWDSRESQKNVCAENLLLSQTVSRTDKFLYFVTSPKVYPPQNVHAWTEFWPNKCQQQYCQHLDTVDNVDNVDNFDDQSDKNIENESLQVPSPWKPMVDSWSSNPFLPKNPRLVFVQFNFLSTLKFADKAWLCKAFLETRQNIWSKIWTSQFLISNWTLKGRHNWWGVQ